MELSMLLFILLGQPAPLLETFSNLTLETFVERINDKSYGSEFIEIEGYSSGEEFKEGTYILSEGEVLIDGILLLLILKIQSLEQMVFQSL